MARHALTDAQWELVRPLLPPERSPDGGRPFKSHRLVLDAILWILRTGSPWRHLPPEFGPHNTVHGRFSR